MDIRIKQNTILVFVRPQKQQYKGRTGELLEDIEIKKHRKERQENGKNLKSCLGRGTNMMLSPESEDLKSEGDRGDGVWMH